VVEKRRLKVVSAGAAIGAVMKAIRRQADATRVRDLLVERATQG